MVRALFIDIGGVLLTNGWDRHARQRAADTFHLELEEMESRHNLNFDTYEIGKISLDDYLQRVIFYIKRPFTAEQFREFMFAQSQAFPKMIELISALKKKYSLKVAVVSNEGRELNAYRIQTFKLDQFIDFFISSSYVHLRKPDAEIYRIALDIAQVPVKEIIYIDDRPLFIEVAESLDIRGIRHIDVETTQKELERLGLSV
jgi:putative hydrolase of the HAD superfamily